MKNFVCIVTLIAFYLSPSFAKVRDTRNKISATFAFENNSFLLGLTPGNGSYEQIRYQPNTPTLYGVEGSAFGLTLGYKTAAPLPPEDIAAKGKTTIEDFRGSLNFGEKQQWLVTGFYSRYNGLYISNSEALPGAQPNSYVLRSDVSVLNTGAGVIYVFSPDQFSIASALFQSARQTESGGSFLGFLGADTFEFSGTSPLVPSSVQSLYGEDALVTKGKISTLGAALGYGYTLTAASFFGTVMGLLGGGNQWREYTVNNVDKTANSATSKVLYGVAIGYNGENFYAGFSGFASSNSYRTSSILFDVAQTTSRVFVGSRF